MSEPCIYVYRQDGIFAMIGIYVDDLPLACNNTQWFVEFKRTLGQRFKIKDLGDLKNLLGMHITRDRVARTVSINQSQYISDMLDKHGMTDCSPSILPMDHGFLSGIAATPLAPLIGHARDVYPSLLGSLQYAAIYSRPDIATALSILGSAQANPSVQHFQALKKLLRYLKGTISMRFTLGGEMLSLSNSRAMQMQIGAMTRHNASHVHDT
jgi:hypothetical protein